jgi:soluble P-type ATPase
VLAAEYVAALDVLQERVPPFPFAEVRAVVECELGRGVEAAFRSFDPEPVASASLAQVHFAVLPGGERVAVKVQRPGIRERMRADMTVLGRLVGWLARLSPRRAQRANLVEFFSEFRRYTLRELDFAEEGRTMERFRRNFAGWEGLVIPEVFWDHTAPGVLTMERAEGLRLREAAVRLAPSVRERLVERLVAVQMQMFVTDGLFHADLHPGNVFFGEDGTITLLDFGMAGTLDAATRQALLRIALAMADVVRPESKEAIDRLHELGLSAVMLTGDKQEVADHVARQLGIDRVIAEVLPDQKSAEIKKLQAEGHVVAMTGDGVNDAPALATADVGLAVGAGTDVAVETADIVLVESDPRAAVRVIALARATYRKMVQNLWWAAGYNIVAIPLAAGVLAPWGVVLSPAVGAVLMSLSTVVVAVNARRLTVE